jgi:hypothetical protein
MQVQQVVNITEGDKLEVGAVPGTDVVTLRILSADGETIVVMNVHHEVAKKVFGAMAKFAAEPPRIVMPGGVMPS